MGQKKLPILLKETWVVEIRCVFHHDIRLEIRIASLVDEISARSVHTLMIARAQSRSYIPLPSSPLPSPPCLVVAL
jgi:hypothetical protein